MKVILAMGHSGLEVDCKWVHAQTSASDRLVSRSKVELLSNWVALGNLPHFPLLVLVFSSLKLE